MAKSYKERLEELQSLSSSAAVTTYLVEDPVMAVTEEETWTLDSKYKSTDSYSYGKRYEDEHISYIDDKKNVKIDENQINLTQENHSQYIPFEMFRYYDGIDLKNMQLSIYYLNPDDDEGETEPINVRYSDTKIRFGFLLPAEATAVSGKLRFEIWAKGTNPFGDKYWLKTKPNSEIEILESLHGSGNIIVDEEWATSVLSQVQKAASDAQTAAANAQSSLDQTEAIRSELYDKIDSVEDDITVAVEEALKETHYTKDETDAAISDAVNSIDGLANFKSTYDSETGELSFYNGTELLEGSPHTLMTNPTEEWSESYKETINNDIVKPAIQELSDELDAYSSEADNRMTSIEGDIASAVAQFDDYYQKNETYSQGEIDELLENVEVDLTDYATKTYVNDKESALSSSISANTKNISSLSGVIGELQEDVSSIDKSPRLTYDVAYNDPDDENVGENGFVFYEIQNEGTESEIKEVKKKFTIVGGSGGGASSSSLKIGYITTSPLVATADDKVLIKYSFSGTDSSGDDVPEGSYTWKIGSKTIATGTAVNGENTFDATDYVSIGTQKLTLQIKDDGGSLVTKSWTVQVVDIRIESTFNDTQTYHVEKAVSFSYTPYGAIAKTIHFKLDGEELYSVNTTSSGVPMSYSIQPREHGSHLVEVYITAEINNSTIESNHIFKDIIWYDSESEIPVIGCVSKDLTVKQYDTASITYTVFDPSTDTPTVVLAVDGKVASTLTLDTNTQTWQYKATEIGSHVLTITCGETVKTINVEVEELDIDVSPVTAGLEFDFNPIGRSNNDTNRLWSDGDVTMTVSDNFDWVNGGYQIDDDGDQYFCVKSGTTATIGYNLFADDPKRNGKEFKVIFKTTNVRNRATSFITCLDNGVGLDMQIEKAYINSNNDALYSPYCENDIIEFEFNINKDTDIPMVLTYEDGVGNRPMIYTSDASFVQATAQPITIGSADCDVYIYRMKAYSNSLSDSDILSNFVADARNAEEMIDRYKRNQIYDENGSLTPESVAAACPDLRVILVDAPWFTNDKSNKVSDTTITMIYKNGDPILDNWTCTGAKHSGQGTSSNEYGYAGRNLDLIMNGDDAVFTLGDGETTSDTITLTRNSTPTNYLNVKVNIASSENQNNAQMTMRFNEYQPYMRTARLRDSKIRDCMEFYNCVVFVRENNEDISTHREFTDTNYHRIA